MLKQAYHIVRNMGLRYALYRIVHEFEKRSGILKRRHPLSPEIKSFISLDVWKSVSSSSFVIGERESFVLEKKNNPILKEKASRILNGEIQFFSHEWKKTGLDYDWITNPDSHYRYDIAMHWSEISDFSKETGDIKYVWEKSRFSYFHTLLRSDYHHNEDHSEFVFSEIESWIDSNPVNQGPNWRCSQEISLRILNWCYALQFYKNSEALTEERWSKIQHVIYWSLHHVYHHINFSRIAVRNNHAITETLFLALCHQLFPFIPETAEWSVRGKKWFEEEIDYQIYEDGTFLQFSMNYHRVVVQLLSLAISVSEKNQYNFSEKVFEKAYKSLNFLYQCMQDENGFLPNYGANDGAWFFPLSDTDYRDFRPQLNTLHLILTGQRLYSETSLVEDSCWVGGAGLVKKFQAIVRRPGIKVFPNGGYYLFREQDTFTFIKCGSYNDRPSHADNLHLDVWYKGENILCDGGSYKYNTDEALAKYFSGTESHNTVMLEKNDQMYKGSRFIWYYWTQATDADIIETEDEFIFTGSIRCFSYINKNIIHKRTVTKSKERPQWIVVDEIFHKPKDLIMRQLWHTNEVNIDFKSVANTYTMSQGWKSLYYGEKNESRQIEFKTTDRLIETKIQIL